jgi:hypothetical protein
VLVTVTEVGLSQPSFPANTVNILISEGALSGTSAYRADATDPDGDVLTYSMSNLNFNQNQNNPDFVISSRYIC